MGLKRYKPNRRGLRDILSSDGVRVDLAGRAGAVAAVAREDYAAHPPHQGEVEVEVFSEGSTAQRVRARAAVIARHPAAQFIEADRHPLGAALDAARDA